MLPVAVGEDGLVLQEEVSDGQDEVGPGPGPGGQRTHGKSASASPDKKGEGEGEGEDAASGTASCGRRMRPTLIAEPYYTS